MKRPPGVSYEPRAPARGWHEQHVQNVQNVQNAQRVTTLDEAEEQKKGASGKPRRMHQACGNLMQPSLLGLKQNACRKRGFWVGRSGRCFSTGLLTERRSGYTGPLRLAQDSQGSPTTGRV